MTRVYLADAQPAERSALRLLLLDLNMQIVGEAADWPTTLAQAPATHPDMLLVDWNLLPNGSGVALAELRMACQAAIVVVLISHLDARQQAALSAGADAFISKGETPDRVAERLLSAAGSWERSFLMTPSSGFQGGGAVSKPAHYAVPSAGANSGSLSEGSGGSHHE